MLRYRTFRNTDPPLVCALWRSRAGQCGFVQPVSVAVLEQLVFGKLHFDYEGLILALDDERPLGFAHASFGPDERQTAISRATGVICVVCVRPDCAEAEVAAGLVERCEEYLRLRGAEVAYGGAVRPRSPFYLGLYGGCDLAGVLDSDLVAGSALRARGFQEAGRTAILRRELSDFRLAPDRQQVQFRRRTMVQVIVDPAARNWWEACTTGDFDLTLFELLPRGGGEPLARAVVRAMDLASSSPSGRAAGVIELEVEPQHRRQGLATFLLGDALRVLASQDVAVVEAQTDEGDAAGIALFGKLGFRTIGHGTIYRKDLDAR